MPRNSENLEERLKGVGTLWGPMDLWEARRLAAKFDWLKTRKPDNPPESESRI